jgi:hypothetical protein
MTFWQRLWNDERGAVVTAELAVLATVGVIGGVVGLTAFAHSVNAELTDAAFAFRSLDQSYSYYGFSQGGRAWVAGSAYTQVDVAVAHAELADVAGVDVRAHVRAEAGPCPGCPTPCAEPPCTPDTAPNLTPRPDPDHEHRHEHGGKDQDAREPDEPRRPSADDLPNPPQPEPAPRRRNDRRDRNDDEREA